jgi:hypothetical protein
MAVSEAATEKRSNEVDWSNPPDDLARSYSPDVHPLHGVDLFGFHCAEPRRELAEGAHRNRESFVQGRRDNGTSKTLRSCERQKDAELESLIRADSIRSTRPVGEPRV